MVTNMMLLLQRGRCPQVPVAATTNPSTTGRYAIARPWLDFLLRLLLLHLPERTASPLTQTLTSALARAPSSTTTSIASPELSCEVLGLGLHEVRSL
jgi:hypothetical protein